MSGANFAQTFCETGHVCKQPPTHTHNIFIFTFIVAQGGNKICCPHIVFAFVITVISGFSRLLSRGCDFEILDPTVGRFIVAEI